MLLLMIFAQISRREVNVFVGKGWSRLYRCPSTKGLRREMKNESRHLDDGRV